MGRSVIVMMKKWWILAVVLTLALSLTSCSGGSDTSLQGSAQTCTGNQGTFDLVLNSAGNGTYNLELDPEEVTQEGIITEIALVDSSGDYKVVDQEESLFSGRPVNISNIAASDLQNFSYLVIANYNPQVKFLQMTNPEFCTLPFGGNASSNGD